MELTVIVPQKRSWADSIMGAMTDALTADKPTCIATTRAGLPCRRPSVRGGVYCVSHMGLNRNEQGAPFGNQNGRKHGFYSAVLDEEKIADLAELVDNRDLSDLTLSL